MAGHTWVIGAAINVVGSILINLGTVCSLLSCVLACWTTCLTALLRAERDEAGAQQAPGVPCRRQAARQASMSTSLAAAVAPACTHACPVPRNVREWQLGVLFFAVGNVLNFVSLGKCS